MIRYLTHIEIDKSKWDQCIDKAANKLIYAYSTYLDAMADQWDAIVMGDYEIVMPLTWRNKFGIKYLYQPAFVQQLGLFSNRAIDNTIVEAFLELAYSKFQFAEINLNFQQSEFNFDKKFIASKKNNFISVVSPSKTVSLFENDSYLRKRLNKASRNDLMYLIDESINSSLLLYQNLYQKKIKSLTDFDFNKFSELCKKFQIENKIIIRKVISKHNNEVLALALLLEDGKRIYNIISCVTPIGKKLLANYFLYNEILKENLIGELVFDFEGSDLPGVADFYKKMSTQNQQYISVKWNRLPKIIRLIKK